ncbi:MAG: substrate-binding domain-containing protein [Pirellulales bacterium]
MSRCLSLWAALGLVVFCGCPTAAPPGTPAGNGGTGASASNNADKELQIAVIPKGTTHEFWKSVHAGAEKAAQELGNVKILWKGPIQENDTDGQISVVQDFVTKRVDGVVLAPNDSQSLVNAVSAAKDAGVPTVIFDSGLDNEEIIVSYAATDNRQGGRLAGQRLAEAMGGQGNAILMRYREGSESTLQREEGFLEALREFPDIKVISSDQYCGVTPEDSLTKCQQMLLKYRDEANGVFTVCEPNGTGMLGALEQAGLAGKIKFVTFDPSQPMVEAMRDGKIDGIVLQDPVTMGYEAVKAMVAHIRGEQAVTSRIQTGEYVATPDNMDEPRMKELLHPVQFGE